MSRVTRSTYSVTELGPDGSPVRSYNAVITPYYAGSSPPGYQPPTDPGIPGAEWKMLDEGWALCIGPFDKPRPLPNAPEGGVWKQLDDGLYYCYITGDKPRPPGPIEPPGHPIDPPTNPPDNNGWLKPPPDTGGWGYHEDYGWVYKPAPGAPGPK